MRVVDPQTPQKISVEMQQSAAKGADGNGLATREGKGPLAEKR